MIVYSHKIIQFITEIKRTIQYILTAEARLKVTTKRFYSKDQRTSYPIKVVIYNNKSLLGYFDSGFYELGFHECLMYSSKEQLHNVIRHELAHYMTWIHHGEVYQPHGAEFRACCQSLGWGAEVSQASFCLDGGRETSPVEESGVLRKVQKLMALTTSANKHEAEQAMIKSRQLLLTHNIESTYLGNEEEKVFLKRIMKQKREDAKMRSIANILETFFVSTVYNRAGEFIYLEILGSAVNVEIAEYVASILHEELDRLWNEAQRLGKLKGLVAKNSFFRGLARGYCNKIEALKKEYRNDVTHALMVIEKQLVDARAMAYEHLSAGKSNAGFCRESAALGELMGKQLNINPAVGRSATASEAQIAYSSSDRN